MRLFSGQGGCKGRVRGERAGGRGPFLGPEHPFGLGGEPGPAPAALQPVSSESLCLAFGRHLFQELWDKLSILRCLTLNGKNLIILTCIPPPPETQRIGDEEEG